MLQTILPKSPASAGAARRLIDRVGSSLDEDERATAHLLVTELVANAVHHVPRDGDLVLEASCDDHGALYVALGDPGRGFDYRPRSASRSSEEPGGWGLHLVDVLSHRWGVKDSRVWFELTPDDRSTQV